MARSKFIVELAVTLAHPDGTKLRKKEVTSYVRGLIEGDDGTDALRPIKAVVRSVDLD